MLQNAESGISRKVAAAQPLQRKAKRWMHCVTVVLGIMTAEGDAESLAWAMAWVWKTVTLERQNEYDVGSTLEHKF